MNQQNNKIISDFLLVLILISFTLSITIMYQKSYQNFKGFSLLETVFKSLILLLIFSIVYLILKLVKNIFYFKINENDVKIEKDYILKLIFFFFITLLVLIIFYSN